MPTRKKEILVSSLDAPESSIPDTSELLPAKPVRPSRPKKKTAQPRVTTKEITGSTEDIKHKDEIISNKLEATPIKEVKEHVILKKKQRKETHTKEKFYIRNDLLIRLKSLTKGKGKKNFYTNFINDALETALNKFE